MKIKKGVHLNGLKLVMRKALITADRVYKHYGKELVITSGTEGEHSPGSLHYYGYAIDIRTNYFSDKELPKVYTELKEALHYRGFDVILHTTHIHIEFTKILAGDS